MNLKERLQPVDMLGGASVLANFMSMMREKREIFKGVTASYAGTDEDMGKRLRTGATKAIDDIFHLLIFSLQTGACLYLGLKALAKSLVGLFTLPYFLIKGQGKETAGFLAKNFGLGVVFLFAVATYPLDIVAQLFIRMPLKGIATGIDTMRAKFLSKGDDNAFEPTESESTLEEVTVLEAPQIEAPKLAVDTTKVEAPKPAVENEKADTNLSTETKTDSKEKTEVSKVSEPQADYSNDEEALLLEPETAPTLS